MINGGGVTFSRLNSSGGDSTAGSGGGAQSVTVQTPNSGGSIQGQSVVAIGGMGPQGGGGNASTSFAGSPVQITSVRDAQSPDGRMVNRA